MTTLSQNLISQLKTFNTYKDMDEYQIRKKIGNKYDIKRARNSELETELNELSEMVRKPKKENVKNIKKSKKSKNITHEMNNPILVNDTLREILLRAEVETINQYCLTTKEANKLCNDHHFWHDKLLLEGLPSFVQYDLKNINVENYIYKFNTDNKFTILYQLMSLANKDARKILIINDIEKHRQYQPTTGIISTSDNEYINVKLFNVLPEKALKKLSHFAKINASLLPDVNISTVEIHYKKDKYQLYLYSTDKDSMSQNTTHYKISYDETLNILTLLLFEKYIDINPDLTIVDSNNVQFYDDTDFRGYNNVNNLLKQTYYETLNSLEKKNGLKI